MLHEILLSGCRAVYTPGQPGRPPDAAPAELRLGTAESYGIERLHLTAGDGWQGLTLTATFHPPGGPAVQMLADPDGFVNVPREATVRGVFGRIVFAGTAEGVRRCSTDLVYSVLPHAGADGEPADPTPSVWEQFLQAFPPGGEPGQVLVKAGTADRAAAWATVPIAISNLELEAIFSK